ncbi:MAG: Nicotinate-nucleotide adenylyltransferase [Planctomycetota bacterium]
MRIGIYGGSFDPVHYGHLLAAETAREQARLDRVIFIPAAASPHKPGVVLASAVDRLAMLTLATAGHEAFAVSAVELDRGGPSYTVDTLTSLAAAYPADQLVLILGPDALGSFATWREPARIASLAELVPVEREELDDVAALAAAGGLADILGAEAAQAIVNRRVRMPAIGIRATAIREAVAAGRSIRYRTPRAVERLIETRGLYR